MEIQWIFYPKTNLLPEFLRQPVEKFQEVYSKIDSTKNDSNDLRLASDEVLRILTPGLESIGYRVERSKKTTDKVRVPVLYGAQGKEELAFEADAYNKDSKTVIEVEAGRAVTNYQFLKDIFQASMMSNTDYLILAMRNVYKGNNDFSKASSFLETIYLTNRIKLDLKGILLIGY